MKSIRGLVVLFLVMLPSAVSYDPLDPTENITIKWDVVSCTMDGYVVAVTMSNFQMYRAQTTEQGDCSKFKGNVPHCCMRTPIVVDLLPEVAYNQQFSNCCKAGIVSAWGQDPSGSVSAFQVSVGFVGELQTRRDIERDMHLIAISCLKEPELLHFLLMTCMFYGMKFYNDLLMEAGPQGNVQSEVLLGKNKDTITFKQGWAFPRKVYFKGDECLLPPPDTYPFLLNSAFVNPIAMSTMAAYSHLHLSLSHPSPTKSVPISGEIRLSPSLGATLTIRNGKSTKSTNEVSLAKTIASKLSPAQRKMFDDTCFGPWLKVQHPGGDAMLTHLFLQTMTRDLPDTIQRRDEEIWFDFPPAYTCFGREEFCLITGLRFGHDDVASTSGAITSPRAITSPEPSSDRPGYTPPQRHPSPIMSHHRASSPPSPQDRRPEKMPRRLSPCSPPPPQRDELGELRDEVNALREEVGTLRKDDGAWRIEVSTLRGEVAALREMVASLQNEVHTLRNERPDKRIRRRGRAITSPFTPMVRRLRKKKPDSPVTLKSPLQSFKRPYPPSRFPPTFKRPLSSLNRFLPPFQSPIHMWVEDSGYLDGEVDKVSVYFGTSSLASRPTSAPIPEDNSTHSGHKKPNKFNVTVVRDETAPQQSPGARGDCGPLVCLCLARLTTGSTEFLPPTDRDRAAVGLWFRHYMARAIYSRRCLPASAL
ncbi:COBRA-like protein 5 [Hibiscus syriacus]|uniref:COBRA-like protein 5 n=1 Tax=Hibiscus syriacus TaxID=106335 RepID=A0A6A3BFV4_HIBSY|nr:COBRA-like protein 5 [Hibiscus syriacus]